MHKSTAGVLLMEKAHNVITGILASNVHLMLPLELEYIRTWL